MLVESWIIDQMQVQCNNASGHFFDVSKVANYPLCVLLQILFQGARLNDQQKQFDITSKTVSNSRSCRTSKTVSNSRSCQKKLRSLRYFFKMHTQTLMGTKTQTTFGNSLQF